MPKEWLSERCGIAPHELPDADWLAVTGAEAHLAQIQGHLYKAKHEGRRKHRRDQLAAARLHARQIIDALDGALDTRS